MCRSLYSDLQTEASRFAEGGVWMGGDCWLGRRFWRWFAVKVAWLVEGGRLPAARLAYKRREICGRRPWTVVLHRSTTPDHAFALLLLAFKV
jgi:hypothetical protein